MADKRNALAHEVDQTITALITKINAFPDDWQNYNDLGVVLTQISDYNSAEELIMKALGLFSDKDATAKETLLYSLGNVYYAAGEYQRAMTYYQQITAVNIKGDAFMMLAQSFMQQQQYQQALVYALTAQENLPNDITVTVLLGDIWLALGEFTQADMMYAQVLDHDSQNVAALFGRGIIALTLGQPSTAFFAKVEALDSKYYADNKQRVDEIATVVQKQQNK